MTMGVYVHTDHRIRITGETGRGPIVTGRIAPRAAGPRARTAWR
ncbi:Uncharacterised protein [Bordetella pertussis]|nr:Uncharacterised protein [Bordetella pertussis]